MIVSCIHGRTANTSESVKCLDCEELVALREVEILARDDGCHAGEDSSGSVPTRALNALLYKLDDIRRRKGIGALGHTETAVRTEVSCGDYVAGETVTTRERARQLFGEGSLMGECPLQFRLTFSVE